jgi:spore coat protein U-like protein
MSPFADYRPRVGSHSMNHASFPLSRPMLVLVTALALEAAPRNAHAASTTTTFNVTATVSTSCAVSASDLAFGNYDPGSAVDALSTSTISVTCSLGTAYTISLDNGTHSAGATRRMGSGASRLTYQMYRDVGLSGVFGLAASALGVSGIGTGIGVPTLLYGKIAAGQVVPPGSYADQVTVTIDY